MAEALHHARCVLHPQREAAGLCISCQRFFCRECVTEHDGRLRCARCLEAEAATEIAAPGTWWVGVKAALQLAAGALAAWLFFLTAAQLLLALPRSAVEGTEQTEIEAGE